MFAWHAVMVGMKEFTCYNSTFGRLLLDAIFKPVSKASTVTKSFYRALHCHSEMMYIFS